MYETDVGIITKMSKNYGAVLQAYALMKAIERYNVDVSIINYNGAVGNDTYLLYKKGFGIRTWKFNFNRWRHRKEIQISIDRFQSFRSRYFNLGEVYKTYNEFRKNPPKCKTYVVGSDQVWNPEILFSPIYYLNFGTPETKRIAYAASFGKKTIHPDYHNEMERLLANFDSISVREDSGLHILRDLGYNAEVVLDPTLLLGKDEWECVASKPSNIPEKYVLCYFLHYPSNVDSLIEDIKAKTGYKIINIATDVGMRSIGDIQRWDIGPQEFVWLFQHARMVLTSSFHGTVFSIIFGRPFFTLSVTQNDARLSSLLNNLGLGNRLIENWNNFNWEEMLNIDYDATMRLLEPFVEQSRMYLKNNL